MKLLSHPVEKPWGRRALPAAFAATSAGADPIGEVWFEGPAGEPQPLLIKYIFTSEKLSVQVHPDDAQAQERGLANGKTECWYIVDAEPGAMLALGFREPIGAEEMRAAALDGSIEERLSWKAVRPGDFFYVPAGTVHAIGAGLSLIEVQQPSDTTYRLYDYGRPRELHLDEGLSVGRGERYPEELASHAMRASALLVRGDHFSVAHALAPDLAGTEDHDRWVLPLAGRVEADGEQAVPGECLMVPRGTRLAAAADARVIVATL